MSDYPKPVSNLVTQAVGDELVVIEPRQSRVFLLNPTATWIWKQLNNAADTQQITQTLESCSGLAREELRQLLQRFYHKLQQQGLIEFEARPMVQTATAPAGPLVFYARPDSRERISRDPKFSASSTSGSDPIPI